MTRDRLTKYQLTPAAQGDLEEIWLYTAHTWSPQQAERYTDALEETFKRLLAMPEMARERLEFTPPVRIHPSGEHLVIYRIETDHLEILRILGGRQDWLAILQAVDQ